MCIRYCRRGWPHNAEVSLSLFLFCLCLCLCQSTSQMSNQFIFISKSNHKGSEIMFQAHYRGFSPLFTQLSISSSSAWSSPCPTLASSASSSSFPLWSPSSSSSLLSYSTFSLSPFIKSTLLVSQFVFSGALFFFAFAWTSLRRGLPKESNDSDENENEAKEGQFNAGQILDEASL